MLGFITLFKSHGVLEGKNISEVYGLGETGLFDTGFFFLEQFGFMALF